MSLRKPARRLPRPLMAIAEFMRLESSSGIVLFVVAVIALVIANSPWGDDYHDIFHGPISLYIAKWEINTTLILWINDLLMAVFFFLVGLEVKREVRQGELNSLAKVSLPAIAALGGIIAPALFYIAFNWHNPVAMRGWAIPTATDIAFALGVMVLLGKRVPLAAKLFLMALAIFDDIAAIVIIALFYTADISWLALGGVFLALLLSFVMNRLQVVRVLPYLVMGVVMWSFCLASGIHPTIAGVLLALTIPLGNLHPIEKTLHPWVAYMVLPIFCFANAGVSFSGMPLDALFSGVPLGIILGLFLGKQIGVFAATYLAVKLRWAPMPNGTNWCTLYGVAMVCGVGFTMSLFVGNLAFADPTVDYPALVRFGVFVGSLSSGLIGYLFLRFGCKS